MDRDLVSVNEQFAISISIVPLLAAGLVTPGYIILFMVSRFTTGRPSFASSLAASSAYYVVVWAVCDFGSAVDVAERVRDFDVNWQVAMIVVGGPAAIGVLAGLAVQKEWLYNVLRFVKLEPVHGIPSAWDWKFMRADQQWITVHLKDGTDILAVYRKDCFVSTDPNERDLYLSNVYTWGDDGRPVRDERVEGLLLKADSIDRIEFHEGRAAGANNED